MPSAFSFFFFLILSISLTKHTAIMIDEKLSSLKLKKELFLF